MNQSLLEQAFKREFRPSKDNWKARCPFHDERTPSFYVHKDDYIGHCFGCGIGGRIDNLLAAYSGISRPMAREILQITAADQILSGRHLKEPKPVKTVFPESWLAPFKKEAHKYVIERGFTERDLRSVGSLYDSNLKRQVFPHRDSDGRLLGCVGRACREQAPKWLFYWQYDKGEALYAPFGIDPLRPTLVVEGVFDLLWVVHHGYDNVTAPIGAQLTERQVRELKGRAGEVIIGLDNDEAGRRGTDRLYQDLKKTTQVSFIRWPTVAKDWMDLSEDQVNEVISTPLNYVQRSALSHSETSS